MSNPSPTDESPSAPRLQKVLAAAGLGSRRECEELIRQGRVEIDRQVVTELGTRADPEAHEIRVDGEALRRPKLLYYAVNKPVGVVTTNHDPSGRSRVIDLVPTILDVAKVRSPNEMNGKPVPPLPGRSLQPAFARDVPVSREELWWLHKDNRALLFFADGFNGDADQLCSTLSDLRIPIAGALSTGDLHTGYSYLMSGPQTGSGALSAAFLRGDFHLGIGAAHGWNPVGSQFRVTRSRGFWLRTLDGKPASESYARLFGYPAREWAFPPLSHLARLYPLGLEQGDQMMIRAPIRVEADGSFRMNAPVRDGVDAFLLVGSRVSCEAAAQDAAQQALRDRKSTRLNSSHRT